MSIINIISSRLDNGINTQDREEYQDGEFSNHHQDNTDSYLLVLGGIISIDSVSNSDNPSDYQSNGDYITGYGEKVFCRETYFI